MWLTILLDTTGFLSNTTQPWYFTFPSPSNVIVGQHNLAIQARKRSRAEKAPNVLVLSAGI